MPESFRTDDELVSAVLDGEATADERARVAADPALSVRLAEFAAVADALRAPATPPPADARDAAIAAAVAEGRRPAQVVVALRPRRSTGSFLAVAAAVLVVLLFAGFLVGQVGDRNETEDSASEAGDDSGSDRVRGGGRGHGVRRGHRGARDRRHHSLVRGVGPDRAGRGRRRGRAAGGAGRQRGPRRPRREPHHPLDPPAADDHRPAGRRRCERRHRGLPGSPRGVRSRARRRPPGGHGRLRRHRGGRLRLRHRRRRHPSGGRHRRHLRDPGLLPPRPPTRSIPESNP